MDNLRVDVTAYGVEMLEAALELAAGPRLATHYVDLPTVGPPAAELNAPLTRPRMLVFLDRPEPGAFPLAVALDAQGMGELAARWLAEVKDEDYGGWLDMDGDCIPDAFRVVTDHVPSERTTLGFRGAICGVQGWCRWIGK